MNLLVDGNSIAWRAFYANSGLSYDNEQTGAAFVFLRMLRSAASATDAKRIKIAWDNGVPRFRLDVLPTYKRSRKTDAEREENAAIRDEWRKQIQWLRTDVLPYLGAEQVSIEGWEADDILAFWTSSIRKSQATIFSGDRDLWQLISSMVSVLYPEKGIINLDNFSEYAKGLETPERWLLFRILTGDGSDGIPGVGGVGEKRGLQLAHDATVIIDWEAKATDLFGEEWVKKRRPLFMRNRTLMDLGVAVAALKRDLAVAEHIGDAVRRVAQSKDLRRVSDVLEDRGMMSLIARFTDWSEPFRYLEQ